LGGEGISSCQADPISFSENCGSLFSWTVVSGMDVQNIPGMSQKAVRTGVRNLR